MMNAFAKKTFLYLSIALIAAILVLVIGGKTVFSLPDSNANPIQIDLSISENQIDIPAEKIKFVKTLKLKISIKNNSDLPWRISLFDDLLPEIKDLDGNTIERDGDFNNGVLMAAEEHFPYVPAKKSLDINQNILIVWRKTSLGVKTVLIIPRTTVGRWFFDISHKKMYDFYFVYNNDIAHVAPDINNIWTGRINTDPLRLVINTQSNN